MKPSARIQTSIELWENLWRLATNVGLPMDKFLGDFFRGNRFIGSKDRADIASRLYEMMRGYARLSWWAEFGGADPKDGRAIMIAYLLLTEKQAPAMINQLFCGEKYAPEELTDAEQEYLKKLSEEKQELEHPQMDEATKLECPAWTFEDMKGYFGDNFEELMRSLMQPAHLHLRVNTRKAERENAVASLNKEGIEAEEGHISPYALRLENTITLSQTKAFKSGLVDIQDEGSQAIALACGAKPGMQILDYCAGGGGKTLALADLMAGKGRIVAMDNNTKRLMRGKKRYIRADIHNVELRSLEEDRHKKWIRRQAEKFDVVLIDAPCSGTGTWRRNPDMRWRDLTVPLKGQPSLEEILGTQSYILNRVAPYVKKGGALVYATCSLLAQENEKQVEAFLEQHPEFEVEPLAEYVTQPEGTASIFTKEGYMRLNPAQHGTDGFFTARLIKSED
jgi:16S rRNA (cytosine967-C5)-methyltransferase